ncbi:MAG: hypothetical protein RBS57_11200 [Desulforhabdus sp.]|jgi:hypothetical protein|nr:hypothetical protein [Desulforhabdus sp.]
MIQEESNGNMPMAEQCDCCGFETATATDSYDCRTRRTVFTQREQAILARIREMSGKARDLKKRIDRLAEGPGAQSQEHRSALSELEDLRQARAELEKERIAAAEERMRLLGHA